jgi:hypothetical protein
MRLRANVVRATGATVHRQAKLVDGAVVAGEQLPVSVKVEIGESRSGGVFLYHYDAVGRCIADTWHATLAEAKEQAKFEFGIEAGDWVEVTD